MEISQKITVTKKKCGLALKEITKNNRSTMV